ncbi:uncharacterized protein LOC142639787 [Castanea sativa]|uniref:uncharacterized protein LOC142639787 n=1 Tax=Castanea sativa TaxID=21020 RepID=UPI003F64A124
MRIDKERLLPLDMLLVRFGDTKKKVFLVGTIALLVTIGTYPQQLTKEVSFLVVDYSSAYNAIIGRPTLNAWRAAMSMYHLLVISTEYRIGEACGDQMAARKCYIAMLEMDDHLQVLNIEERRVTVEPIDDLDVISLEDNYLGWITRISTQTDPSICKELALFLKNNQDVFAWSHVDMLGINPNIMVHKLNVSSSFPLVRQKKRVFAQKRDKAIVEEICKLLEVDFIREVY